MTFDVLLVGTQGTAQMQLDARTRAPGLGT